MAEIIVTGQKRAENIQEVPKQVAVASQIQLENAGVSRLTELQNVFPTITAQPQNQTPRNPGIRGIAPTAFSVGVQSQTGIVVDDIPQSTFSTLAFALTDIDRVEVFAGPQSTLSGRNAAAGIINFVTRTPSKQPEYDFHVEQTSDRESKATAFLTGPLTGTVSYSLSILYDKWDGDLRNALLNEERVDGYDTKGARGKVLWEPTDRLSMTMSAYYIKTERTTPALLSGGTFVHGSTAATFVFDAQRPARTLSQLYPGINVGNGNRQIYAPSNGSAETVDQGGTFRADYDLGNAGTLSSLTSYTHSTQPRTDVFFGAPQDNLVLPVTDFKATTNINTKYYTQEVRLASPGSGPFTYLVGGIYTHTDLFQPYLRAQIFPVDWDQGVTIGSAAVFARATYEFTQADSLTLGLRYQHDRLGYSWRFIPIRPTDPNTYSSGDNNYSFPAGELSYTRKFSKNVHAYVTYAQSETGKAYDLQNNGDAALGTLQPLQSESVRSWEIGLKSELLDHRATFNIDGFLSNYRNYQIQTATTGSLSAAPTIRLLSIGKVQSKGVELSSSLRATPNFVLNFNGAYIDSEIKSFPGAACYIGQTAAAGCINKVQGDLSGLPLPYSSRWVFTGGADYKVPMSGTNLDFGTFYRYQSSQHYDVFGDPLTYQGGFGTLNIYGGFSHPDGKWSVQLFVNNVLNKYYVASLGHTSYYRLSDGTSPMVSASYDRASFLYGGVRASVKF